MCWNVSFLHQLINLVIAEKIQTTASTLTWDYTEENLKHNYLFHLHQLFDNQIKHKQNFLLILWPHALACTNSKIFSKLKISDKAFLLSQYWQIAIKTLLCYFSTMYNCHCRGLLITHNIDSVLERDQSRLVTRD